MERHISIVYSRQLVTDGLALHIYGFICRLAHSLLADTHMGIFRLRLILRSSRLRYDRVVRIFRICCHCSSHIHNGSL